MRRVVSNTGPLLHLHEAQALALLNKVGAVHIPRAVDAEIAQHIPDWQTQLQAQRYAKRHIRHVLYSP